MMRLAQRLTPQPPRPLQPAVASTTRQAKPTPVSQRKAGGLQSHEDGSAGEVWRRAGNVDVAGTDKVSVVLVTTATGSYNRFVDPLVESAHQYLLAGDKYDVFYVVFTDAMPPVSRHPRVTYVYRRDLGWPLTAMLRYQTFLDCWHLLAHADFIFRYVCNSHGARHSGEIGTAPRCPARDQLPLMRHSLHALLTICRCCLPVTHSIHFAARTDSASMWIVSSWRLSVRRFSLIPWQRHTPTTPTTTAQKSQGLKRPWLM